MLGVTIAAQMALGRGDHALVISPVWPNIDAVFQITGASFDHVRQQLTPEGWALDLDALEAGLTPRTRALFVNSPCNPTGWVMPRAQQQALLALARERGFLIIADEVYHRTVYGARAAPSFLEIARDDDPVVVVNGFSKAWAMTGWRVGWVVAPSVDAVKWTALSECFNTGATVFAQLGAVAALEQGEGTVRELQAQYERGRDLVTAYLGNHPARALRTSRRRVLRLRCGRRDHRLIQLRQRRVGAH